MRTKNVMENLSILHRNICDSLYHENEDVMNEAQRLFLEYSEKDVYPFYKAEEMARLWIQTRNLLSIAEEFYPDAPHEEIKDFFMARMPNMWRLTQPEQDV